MHPEVPRGDPLYLAKRKQTALPLGKAQEYVLPNITSGGGYTTKTPVLGAYLKPSLNQNIRVRLPSPILQPPHQQGLSKNKSGIQLEEPCIGNTQSQVRRLIAKQSANFISIPTPDQVNTNLHTKDLTEGKAFSSASTEHIYLRVYCPIQHVWLSTETQETNEGLQKSTV